MGHSLLQEETIVPRANPQCLVESNWKHSSQNQTTASYRSLAFHQSAYCSTAQYHGEFEYRLISQS
jgi:hypothetical protein